MEIDYQVVKRYLERKEKKGDKEQLIEWFSDIRFEKEIRKKYRQFWDEFSGHEDMEDCDGSVLLGRIYRKMKNDEFKKPSGSRGNVRILNIISKIAAAILIPLVIFMWITNERETRTAFETAYSEIYSPLGARTMFYLPDGSSGWLNGGSHLKFPVQFRKKTRNVVLNGEAYFNVVSDPKKPFVVKAEHIDVIAYGTSFNVQAYREDSDIQVTLASGKVSIYTKINRETLKLGDLKQGQMSEYYPEKRLHRIKEVDVSLVTAWKDGKLAFRDENFVEIVKKINRWYNVELMIMDEALKTYSYQATFMDETLDEVLKLLQFSAPIRFKDLGRLRRPDGTYEKRKIEMYYNRPK